jgi:hypothetical protein
MATTAGIRILNEKGPECPMLLLSKRLVVIICVRRSDQLLPSEQLFVETVLDQFAERQSAASAAIG